MSSSLQTKDCNSSHESIPFYDSYSGGTHQYLSLKEFDFGEKNFLIYLKKIINLAEEPAKAALRCVQDNLTGETRSQEFAADY